MKFGINAEGNKGFKPVTVSFTFENKEELAAFLLLNVNDCELNKLIDEAKEDNPDGFGSYDLGGSYPTLSYPDWSELKDVLDSYK